MNVEKHKYLNDRCTGCSACTNVCPSSAISMIPDDEGFLYPHVDNDKCIDCGKCNDVCIFLDNKHIPSRSMDELYAFQSIDKTTLINATSGGLFPSMAQYVIKNGGAVYGAAYDEFLSVVHKEITKIDDIHLFNGSKYVQSQIDDAYFKAEKKLKSGSLVLFSGTPCQIDGLYSYLDREYNNLITVDLICYGVPSEMFFKKYIEYVEEKEKAKVIDFKFRDKHKFGWSHTVVITFKKNQKIYDKIYGNEVSNLWYRAWANTDCLRNSCYDCKYVSKKRCSDFTIGNFWGIEQVSSKFKYSDGVSFLSVNNPQKNRFIQNVLSSGIYEKQDWTMVDKIQHGLKCPKKRSPARDVFYMEIQKGYMHMVKKMYPLTSMDKLLIKIPIQYQRLFFWLVKILVKIRIITRRIK